MKVLNCIVEVILVLHLIHGFFVRRSFCSDELLFFTVCIAEVGNGTSLSFAVVLPAT